MMDNEVGTFENATMYRCILSLVWLLYLRSLLNPILVGIPNLSGLGQLSSLLHEGIVDTSLDEGPRASTAVLSVVVEDGSVGNRGSLIN
jgi:hypothetical protein